MINQLYITHFDIPSSIMSTVSAVIGIIPEGLVLLTSSAMAVSVIRLRRYNVLVQELYSIENLARVDVICLDKTGTITEGEMEVKDIIPYKNKNVDNIKKILGNYINAMDDNSLTFKALTNYIYISEDMEYSDIISFSSSRKYSGVKFKNINYYLGSPENLLNKKYDEIEKYQDDYRVLVLVSSKNKFGNVSKCNLEAIILIQDNFKILFKKNKY